jgi:ABC-2 type transport system permease protein
MSDSFYWPTIDLLLWGLTSVYFKNNLPGGSYILLTILSGILLWIIVWRGQYEITVNMLEDLWNKNLVNIFVSPLKFSEWLISFLIIGVVKSMISFCFALLMAFLLYKVNVFYYGWYFIPFMASLIMTGWAVGFFVAGLILRFGTRVQTFAWTTVMVLSPFSAIYYPVSILPGWAQFIAKFVPTSYIFEGSREVLYQHHLDPMKLVISFTLNIIYLFFAVLFIRKSFNSVLQKGLVKVY